MVLTQTATPTPVMPEPEKKSGSKVWIWVLVGVGVLIAVGVVGAVAVIMGFSLGRVAPTNTANTSGANAVSTSANAITNTASNAATQTGGLSTYLTDATAVIQEISNAVDKWSTAADKGSSGDIPGSTAALNSGLTDVKTAEAGLAKLTPDSQTAHFNDLLTQAVAKTREAMEQGILGNSSESNASALTKSAAAIQDVGTLLDKLGSELKSLSQGLPNGAV